MHKKSTVNPPAPFVSEGKPRGKGIPGNPPQAKARSGASKAGVILTEAKPSKGGSTFRAPRGGGDGSSLEKGYTKVSL